MRNKKVITISYSIGLKLENELIDDVKHNGYYSRVVVGVKLLDTPEVILRINQVSTFLSAVREPLRLEFPVYVYSEPNGL